MPRRSLTMAANRTPSLETANASICRPVEPRRLDLRRSPASVDHVDSLPSLRLSTSHSTPSHVPRRATGRAADRTRSRSPVVGGVDRHRPRPIAPFGARPTARQLAPTSDGGAARVRARSRPIGPGTVARPVGRDRHQALPGQRVEPALAGEARPGRSRRTQSTSNTVLPSLRSIRLPVDGDGDRADLRHLPQRPGELRGEQLPVVCR